MDKKLSDTVLQINNQTNQYWAKGPAFQLQVLNTNNDKNKSTIQ